MRRLKISQFVFQKSLQKVNQMHSTINIYKNSLKPADFIDVKF